LKHAVEEGYGEAAMAKESGGVERPEWRIRLHLSNLLAVVVEVVGMREENVDHDSAPVGNAPSPSGRGWPKAG
jgi:hypothetical protein